MLSDRTSNDMELAPLEATSHPFFLRIWLEDGASEAYPATWRGHITHVPSGKRRYLKDLDEIATFIKPYLEEIGIRF